MQAIGRPEFLSNYFIRVWLLFHQGDIPPPSWNRRRPPRTPRSLRLRSEACRQRIAHEARSCASAAATRQSAARSPPATARRAAIRGTRRGCGGPGCRARRPPRRRGARRWGCAAASRHLSRGRPRSRGWPVSRSLDSASGARGLSKSDRGARGPATRARGAGRRQQSDSNPFQGPLENAYDNQGDIRRFHGQPCRSNGHDHCRARTRHDPLVSPRWGPARPSSVGLPKHRFVLLMRASSCPARRGLRPHRAHRPAR